MSCDGALAWGRRQGVGGEVSQSADGACLLPGTSQGGLLREGHPADGQGLVPEACVLLRAWDAGVIFLKTGN